MFFRSAGHFLATVFHKVLGAAQATVSTVAKDAPVVVAAIQQVEATAPVVEAVTATIPVYGPLGLTLEKAGYAVLGEIGAAIAAGGAAAKANLANAGLDQAVIATVEELLKAVPESVATVKAKAA